MSDSEKEAALLGGIILRPALMDDVRRVVGASDFKETRHRYVYMAMLNLHKRGDAIDVVTLEGELDRMSLLSAIGGVAFIGELALRVPTEVETLRLALRLPFRDRDGGN